MSRPAKNRIASKISVIIIPEGWANTVIISSLSFLLTFCVDEIIRTMISQPK